MSTVEITLAKALKLKNRLAGRLAKIDSDLQSYNSVQVGSDQPDIRGLYAERAVLVARLIDLKVAIQTANVPRQRTICEMGEQKSLIALLSKLNTKHGSSVEGYAGTEVEWIAQFRKGEIDREVLRIEREIDRLQDALDEFNHRTVIAVDAGLLEYPEPPVASES
jgi:hypothetical protein